METRPRCHAVYEPEVVNINHQKQSKIFTPPNGVRRVVIFSNVKTFNVTAAELKAGDWCIHINHAVHAQEAMKTAGTWHSLFVRHGQGQGTGFMWHSPSSHAGFNQVVYFRDEMIRPHPMWLYRYRQQSKQSNPTSGFICYQVAKEIYPHLPIILAGFSPDTDASYRWPQHGWEYEAKYYREHAVTIIRP